MFLKRLLQPASDKAAAERLYAATVAEARAPSLYAELGAPDTPDGRFELYTLFVHLVLERLRGEGPSAGALAQAYFDTYVSGLDHGLRELAVGDLTVPKTMRKLAEAFYGRGKALTDALAALPDRAALVELLRRTVFAGDAAADPNPLAERILTVRAELAATAFDNLLQGELRRAAA